MIEKFKGLGVAIVTPFNTDKSIDFKGLEKLINYLIDNGVDYIVSLGTTGETPSLSDKERYEILDFTKEIVAKRVSIVAGFGGNDTQHVLNAFKEYSLDGIDGILSVAPYYNKPSQEGIYLHYAAIADACGKPVILYNVPSRTGCNIDAKTTLRLAHDCENIIGIKEASGDMTQFMDILYGRPDDFLFISGDDNLAFSMVGLGADGVISVLGNAYPAEMNALIHLALDNSVEAARTIHFRLLNIMQLIFKEGNPGGIKAILKILDLCEDAVRLPLANISPAVFEEIREEVGKLEGIVLS